MKKLFMALVLFFSLVGVTFAAQTVTLAWDPNTDTVIGYRIYERAEGSTYVYGEANAKASTLVGVETVTFQTTDGKKYYVATAYDVNAESGPSNEVSTGPNAPGVLRITVIVGVEVPGENVVVV